MKNKYLPFEEAREFVRGLGLKSIIEWKEYSKSGKRPKDIPSSPNTIYRDKGWVGLKDWLGYDDIGNSILLNIEDFLLFLTLSPKM